MSRQAWADAIAVTLDADGLPARASIAAHVRAAAATQRFLLRSKIVRGLKESYRPFGLDDATLTQAIHRTLAALERIGDLTAFASDGGPGYVATPERLVDLGDGQLAVLGASDLAGQDPLVLTRTVASQDLADQDVPVLSLAEELGPAAWRTHLVAAGGGDAPKAGPQALFAHLAGLARVGDRLERTGAGILHVLSGTGPFFGDPRAPSGRWTALPAASEAVFCSVRRLDYGWREGLAATGAQGEVRVFDLEPDVWRWAVVGQTLAAGDPVAEWADGLFMARVRPPDDIRRLLDLAGAPDGSWRWRVGEPAARLALQRLGQAAY